MILAQYRLLTLPLDPATPTDGFNMECRIYWVDGKLTGLPPRPCTKRAIGNLRT